MLKTEEEKLISLYKQGLNDADISRIINRSKSYVFRWRTANKLPFNNNKAKNKAIYKKLTPDVLEILAGTLLGDGALQYYPEYRWKTPKIKIDHGIQQREYAIFLYKSLKNYSSKIRFYRRKNNKFVYTVTTGANPAFFDLYNYLYINKVKHITVDFLNFFTIKSLAYLFMDDGYYQCNKKDKSYVICTDCFPLEEQFLLAQHLLKIANLHFTPIKRTFLYKKEKRTYYRLRLSTKDMKLFANLIKPYILSTLTYKLGPFAE